MYIFCVEFINGAICMQVFDTLEHKGIGKYRRKVFQCYLGRSDAIQLGRRLLKIATSLARVVKHNEPASE